MEQTITAAWENDGYILRPARAEDALPYYEQNYNPLDPEAAWRKAVTSSTLWLVGGIALIAFYLSGARAGVVTIDSGVMILLVLIGCYCLYLASALGKLWKQKPGSKGKKK